MKRRFRILSIYTAVLLVLLIVVMAANATPDRSPGRMNNDPEAAWMYPKMEVEWSDGP